LISVVGVSSRRLASPASPCLRMTWRSNGLRAWLDSLSGIGHAAVRVHRQGYDLQLTQYDERGRRLCEAHRATLKQVFRDEAVRVKILL
jgi:hypothetical protein